MTLTERSLASPFAVAVGVGLIAVIGLVSLVRLPVQLFPNIEEPQVSIRTDWRAAAPAEVESQLIEPQERALRGLPVPRHVQRQHTRARRPHDRRSLGRGSRLLSE